MKYSTGAILALLAGAQAVDVYVTEVATAYVTVDGSGNTIGQPAPKVAPQATSAAAAVANQEHGHEQAPANVITFVKTATADAQPAPKITSSPQAPAPQAAPSPAASSDDNNASQDNASSAASSPAPSSDDSGLSDFAKDIVDYHNKVRAQHNVGPVTWNQTIADFAQQYLAGDNCVFKHSGGPYGENIALGYPTTDGALDAWYNENTQYNYAAADFTEDTGHFTQMVWKDSDTVGCYQQDCGGSGNFLVCEYYPRGNIIGSFAYNVLN